MTDPYLTAWDAAAYLRQYYATPFVPDDSRALLGFLIGQLSAQPGGYDTALEFGCGPALYTALALTPHVRQLHLADYLPGNLAELRRWLTDEPGAHDWETYTRYILEQESGRPPTSEEVATRERTLRQKVASVSRGNVRDPLPLGRPAVFDLVSSCFCIECASPTRSEWEVFLARLTSLVAPGGRLLLIALRSCTGYRVFDREYPAASVDESDYLRLLPALGFCTATLVIQAIPVQDWAAEGFDGICCISAERSV